MQRFDFVDVDDVGPVASDQMDGFPGTVGKLLQIGTDTPRQIQPAKNGLTELHRFEGRGILSRKFILFYIIHIDQGCEHPVHGAFVQTEGFGNLAESGVSAAADVFVD